MTLLKIDINENTLELKRVGTAWVYELNAQPVTREVFIVALKMLDIAQRLSGK